MHAQGYLVYLVLLNLLYIGAEPDFKYNSFSPDPLSWRHDIASACIKL